MPTNLGLAGSFFYGESSVFVLFVMLEATDCLLEANLLVAAAARLCWTSFSISFSFSVTASPCCCLRYAPDAPLFEAMLALSVLTLSLNMFFSLGILASPRSL